LGQTQRSLEHFSIGKDLMAREMIMAYAILKRRPGSFAVSQSRAPC
jgi:fumarate hydratase class II